MEQPPKAFISYAWESAALKAWVRKLATRLRENGVDVTLDQWETAPGDQLPKFMETAVRTNDYVVIICTPTYKQKSDRRKGGVGYEGDIMTAEVLITGNHKKFIPALRIGEWHQSAPSWLKGKVYVDLRDNAFKEGYEDLLTTLLGTRPVAPPIGPRPKPATTRNTAAPPEPSAPIRITGVIVDEVTKPRSDKSPGAALYTVPLRLSRTPSPKWAELFVQTWDHPPSFTTVHRPGIAQVVGDKVILNGTTIEEVKQYHRATLKLVVDEVNRKIERNEKQRKAEEERRREEETKHAENVRRIAEDLDFD